MKSVIDFANQVKDYAAAGKAIASVENGTTAVGSYAVGEQFIREGVLYKAKTSITAGDTLTLNTNYELAEDLDTQIGNVKQALSNEVVTRSTLGAHNLGVNFQLGTTVIGGLTFTRNADDSVTVTGTDSSYREYIMASRADKNYYLPNGQYILSGGYSFNVYVTVGRTVNGAWQSYATSSGSETPFTINGDDFSDDGAYLSFYIDAKGTDLDVTLYPMIRLATDTDSTYRPFSQTNRELAQQKFSYKDNGVLGAKSLHPLLLSTTTTSAGVTFTVNNDDTVTLSGTGSNFSLVRAGFAVLKKGTYKISGNAIESSDPNADYALSVRDENDTILGSTVINPIFTLSEDTNCRFVFYVKGGINTAGKVFKPMITLATDTDPTYQPYAMTNKELTDVAQQEIGRCVTVVKSVRVSFNATKTVAEGLAELHEALWNTAFTIDGAYAFTLDSFVGYSPVIPQNNSMIFSDTGKIGIILGRMERTTEGLLKFVVVNFSNNAANCSMDLITLNANGTQTTQSYTSTVPISSNYLSARIIEYFPIQ